MKNKIDFKKYLIISILTVLIFTILFSIALHLQYIEYTKNVNENVSGILEEIISEYPNVDKNEIVDILNGKKKANGTFLKEYGIDIEKEAVFLSNDKIFHKNIIQSVVLVIGVCALLILIFIWYNLKKDRKIQEITRYIEEINQKNYSLKIENNTEDELSILQNELYKITVMLREQADNSMKDKLSLKDSLADISHQIKTPLTSISIMLDNILDDEDMNPEVRNDFIKDIRNEIQNITILVNSILKLSKFDTNTITLNNKEENLKEMLVECKKNLLPICDLKNVTIKLIGDDVFLLCDRSWCKEAFTNIMKNCVEHSNTGGVVEVSIEDYKIYKRIAIKDYGSGISKEDLPHIFERFYKGKNSSNSSIGIGLALAKAIIKNENGYIDVLSESGKGTLFSIIFPM